MTTPNAGSPLRRTRSCVDAFDSRPAKPLGAIGKPILPPLAFKIVDDLIRG
jgi:hypothetical protein